MTSFKKIISVFMAAVMLLGVLSCGMIGLAAEFDAESQYAALADALRKNYVSNLTNYAISNTTLENGAEGFDADANGFAYEHRVTARDNRAGDILKAANIFYYILENIMSTEYGTGLYDPGMIHGAVTARLKHYFNGGSQTYYEDFYGNQYEPTEEEIAAYENAVSLLEAVDREVTPASLSSFRIYFMEKDEYSFYHVDTIIQYFLGNALKINAGNWFHRYVFVAETSLDTWLTESGDINHFASNTITVRKAVYELDYTRIFNETKAKAFYAFKKPTLGAVFDNYAAEFGFTNASDDLSGDNGLTETGQAAAFMIKEFPDTETITYLRTAYNKFKPYIEAAVDGDGHTWDYQFSKMNESQLEAVPNAADIIQYMDDLGRYYSNAALLNMFGENIGNMVSLAYILKPMSTMPSRTVRGTATYDVTVHKLNTIVTDMDNLVYSPNTDTAKRVSEILKQFFNTNSELFQGTQVQGLEFNNLKELVSILLNGLVFRDSIINKLVGLIYPLIVNLFEEKLIGLIKENADWISGTVETILNKIITKNELAIYPNQLAAQISSNYPDGKFSAAAGVLNAAGKNWNAVNMEALTWGVDAAPVDQKASAFVDAFCAALSGFRLLLVTVMCGDAEYKNNARKEDLSWCDDNQFTEYYDKILLNGNLLAQNGVLLRAQGGYTKLIIPLLRLFGLSEIQSYNPAYDDGSVPGFLSSKAYHDAVDAHGDNCLRMIIKPIVYWATEKLAAHPFTELWKLLPNLIYFFTRTSTVSIEDDWCQGTSTDDHHDYFYTCQTHSLATIMAHVHIDLTIIGIQTWNSSIAAFLGDDIAMLQSLNGLLNKFLNMTYDTGVVEQQLFAAYSNAAGDVVLPNSVEYVSDPSAYPNSHLTVYTDETESSFVLTPDETHQVEYTRYKYKVLPYKIPQIQEAKITSTVPASEWTEDCGAIGTKNTAWNTINVRNPGVVLQYVLRFVISALGYKFDISDGAADQNLPYLIECFGLKIDRELFQGLNLQDIIYNVMLHPDEAICALLELFYSNEDGEKFTNTGYTYPMEEINYHGGVLLNPMINPTLTYGTPVRYTKYWTREFAQDTISNAGKLIPNILVMLGYDEFKDGFGPFLAGFLNEKVFNNDIINKLFNTVYQLLGGLNDKVGFDIEKVLKAAYNITYAPVTIGNTLDELLGYETSASEVLKNATKWSDVFPVETVTDPVTHEVQTITLDAELDWGYDVDEDTLQNTHEAHGRSAHDAFLRVVSALLSPAGFAIRYLMRDEHIQLLGLLDIDAYAGYHYAWIGLLEALSCPDILTYKQYYNKTNETAEGTKIGDANAIYYMLSPLGSLLDTIYEDPITNILELIPNLMFFISIGGMNDLLNNLVHCAYVLLDILKPIINGYDLLDGLLANIDIKGYKLNLSLPLDVDFNALVSDLIGVLVGDKLKINDVQITLPYLDFHTLCCGKLNSFSSKEERSTVRLDSADGADLFTAVIRLIFEVLFMEENRNAVAELIVAKVGTDENGDPKLDSYDKRTLLQILDQLYTLMETYEVPDMLMFAVYQLANKLTPLSGRLANTLSASGMTIQDLFNGITDPQSFIATVNMLASNMGVGVGTVDPDGTISNPIAATGLLARLRAFFQKIIDFFTDLFGL